jgi:homospermidine synthase
MWSRSRSRIYLTAARRAGPAYRPPVHYAYRPCDDAVLALLMDHKKGVYWYGSQLTIHQARVACPTTLPPACRLPRPTAGVVWALKHPGRGIVEPDEMPFDETCSSAVPKSATWSASTGCWTLLADRERLFDETSTAATPGNSRTFASEKTTVGRWQALDIR